MKVFGKWLVLRNKKMACSGVKTKKEAIEFCEIHFELIDGNVYADKNGNIYEVVKNTKEYK